MKSGKQTSEFWSKNVLQVVMIFIASLSANGTISLESETALVNLAPLIVPLIVTAFAELGYQWSRTTLKKAHAESVNKN